MTTHKKGRKQFLINGKPRTQSRLVVERVLGRLLKSTEIVHHVNLDESDDRNENLVVCQDKAYHNMLHRRLRARLACGDANKRHCQFCNGWDLPGENGMVVDVRNHTKHKQCFNVWLKRWRRERAA